MWENTAVQKKNTGYLMGIDLGTSSVKVAVFDPEGNEKGFAKNHYRIVSLKNGYAEQEPEAWWQACCDSITEILYKSGITPDQILSVGFSGQMHGLVMLDRNGAVLRPAIIHCDLRSSEEADFLRNTVQEEWIENELLNLPYPGFLLASLLWVRRHEPYIYEKIHTVLLPKDYIRFRMTGGIATDFSDGSGTYAFDIKNRKWADQLLDTLHISKSIFPPCYNSYDTLWQVSETAAKETGLKRGMPVSCGGGDLIMQAVGNGAVGKDYATVNIGSSGQVAFMTDFPLFNRDLNTNTFCAYRQDKWITAGAIMSAGMSLGFIKNLLKPGVEADGSFSGLLYLPYLSGERTPHLDPDLRGMILGLSASTSASQVYTAVLEGVAFALFQCMEICNDLGMTAQKIILSGGGGYVGQWRQIQSDIYNTPLYTTEIREQAAFGAAITAGAGIGLYRNVEEGCKAAVRYCNDITLPNPDRHMQYMEYYGLYKQAYEANRGLLKKITNLNKK